MPSSIKFCVIALCCLILVAFVNARPDPKAMWARRARRRNSLHPREPQLKRDSSKPACANEPAEFFKTPKRNPWLNFDV